MTTKKFMKVIIISKLVLGLLALSLYQGWLSIGDVSLFAEEDSTTESKTAQKDKSTAEKDKSPDGRKESDKDGAASADKSKDSARKSFLSELFELPKLDSKTARKEEIGKYLDMADRKDKQIQNRESLLAKREDQLKAIEKSIDEKLLKLDEERKFIAKTLQQEKDLKGERLEKLIALYDKMEPKKAAPQIEKLDKDLVVGLFKGLKQKQVTTILEAMSPDKGVEITEYFGRVKSGREYDLLKELNSSLKKEFADCKGMPEAQIAMSPKPDVKGSEKSSKPLEGSATPGTSPEKDASKPAH